MGRLAAALAAALLASGAPAAAQTTSRPGPWALDLRGITSPVPDDRTFYPPLHSSALVPARGFGLDLGVHVYLFNLGRSRIGVGANAVNVRATTQAAAAPPSTTDRTPAPRQAIRLDMRLVAPQLSFNFGAREGWSYLSAGVGIADIAVQTAEVNAGRRESGRLNALNFGGGARWFLKSHLAFTFDLRMHRIAAGNGGSLELETGPSGAADPPPAPTPGMMILVVGGGVSFR